MSKILSSLPSHDSPVLSALHEQRPGGFGAGKPPPSGGIVSPSPRTNRLEMRQHFGQTPLRPVPVPKPSVFEAPAPQAGTVPPADPPKLAVHAEPTPQTPGVGGFVQGAVVSHATEQVAHRLRLPGAAGAVATTVAKQGIEGKAVTAGDIKDTGRDYLVGEGMGRVSAAIRPGAKPFSANLAMRMRQATQGSRPPVRIAGVVGAMVTQHGGPAIGNALKGDLATRLGTLATDGMRHATPLSQDEVIGGLHGLNSNFD